jgi:hypothetical protein
MTAAKSTMKRHVFECVLTIGKWGCSGVEGLLRAAGAQASNLNFYATSRTNSRGSPTVLTQNRIDFFKIKPGVLCN